MPIADLGRVLVSLSHCLLTLAAAGGLLLWLEGGSLGARLVLLAEIGFAGVLAAAVGFSELLSRYRDDPWRLFGSPPARTYMAVNILAGVGALAMLRVFGTFTPQQPVSEALAAGFGAIAFFRTSLFTARIGGADVGIGPATLLKALLDSFDREVNRNQAGERAGKLDEWLAPPGIDFGKAKAALPALCLTLVEMLPKEEQDALGKEIADLAQDRMIPEDAKAAILLAKLMRLVGASTLGHAIATLGPAIRK